MTVTFFGHASFVPNEKYVQKMMDLLDHVIDGQRVNFYLGGYGGFDRFANDCCKQYRFKHPEVRLIWVTPYPIVKKQDYITQKDQYDEILYPPLEHVPPKYAILHRNRYMVEQADVVVVYIDHAWGGAYQAYHMALRKGKRVYNLAPKR